MITGKFRSKSPFYYPDRLKIYIPYSNRVLIKSILPWNKLKNNCFEYWFRKTKYGCTLDFHFPNKQCIKLLIKSMHSINLYYISYLEITADFPCPSAEKAKAKASVASQKIIVKNNSHYKHDIHPEEAPEGKYLGNEIWYWGIGKREMRLTIYYAYTETNRRLNIPCVHMEWRLRRARTIGKYTGVRKLEDLLDSDFHDFFQNHCRRFLRFLRVDHKLHGHYLLASKTHDPIFAKDESISDELAKEYSRRFCRKKKILHAVDFKKYYRAQGTL